MALAWATTWVWAWAETKIANAYENG